MWRGAHELQGDLLGIRADVSATTGGTTGNIALLQIPHATVSSEDL